jgi:hypothetical protein
MLRASCASVVEPLAVDRREIPVAQPDIGSLLQCLPLSVALLTRDGTVLGMSVLFEQTYGAQRYARSRGRQCSAAQPRAEPAAGDPPGRHAVSLGGENLEFVPSTPSHHVRVVLEKWRASIEGSDFGPAGKVTVSLSVAERHSGEWSGEARAKSPAAWRARQTTVHLFSWRNGLSPLHLRA